MFTYPSPLPRRVAKGEMLAALDGVAVRAPYPAYFYPALDGQEGHWFYAKLWPDFAPFPFFRPAVLLDNGIQRSEEHTSELQSRINLVCRLLLEKKKTVFYQ